MTALQKLDKIAEDFPEADEAVSTCKRIVREIGTMKGHPEDVAYNNCWRDKVELHWIDCNVHVWNDGRTQIHWTPADGLLTRSSPTKDTDKTIQLLRNNCLANTIAVIRVEGMYPSAMEMRTLRIPFVNKFSYDNVSKVLEVRYCHGIKEDTTP